MVNVFKVRIDLPFIVIIKHFVSLYTNLINLKMTQWTNFLKAHRRHRFWEVFGSAKKSQYYPTPSIRQKIVERGGGILRETFGFIFYLVQRAL